MKERAYSQRRACDLVGINPRVYRYRSNRPDDSELRQRMRELASERKRFGYRHARETVEAWRIDYNLRRPHTSLDGLTPREYHQRSEEGQTLNRAKL